MRSGLVEDLKSEGRLTVRVVVSLVIFHLLRSFPQSVDGSWATFVFVVELIAAIAAQWAIFTLMVVRPTLDLKWHHPDGKPINSTHVTMEWSRAEPAKFFEIQITYRESGLVARFVGARLASRFNQIRVNLSPAMANVIVENGRGLITQSSDNTGFVIPVPSGRPEFFTNPTISVNPLDGCASTTVRIHCHPENSKVGWLMARVIYFRTSVETIELVFDNRGP